MPFRFLLKDGCSIRPEQYALEEDKIIIWSRWLVHPILGIRASDTLYPTGRDFAMGYSQSKLVDEHCVHVSTTSCAPRIFAAPFRGRKAV